MFMVKTMTVTYYLQALYGLAFSLSVVFCSIATRGRRPTGLSHLLTPAVPGLVQPAA